MPRRYFVPPAGDEYTHAALSGSLAEAVVRAKSKKTLASIATQKRATQKSVLLARKLRQLKPGKHPLDKLLIGFAKDSGVARYPTITSFVRAFTEKYAHIGLMLVEGRTRTLLDYNLLPIHRGGPTHAGRKSNSPVRTTAAPLTTTVRDRAAMEKNPHFKLWNQFGNTAVLAELKKETQGSVPNAQKIAQLEELLILVNPKTLDSIRARIAAAKK